MGTPDTDDWPRAVHTLASRVRRQFDALLPWTDVEPALADFRPAHDAWSVREVCEHVVLADRFLLVLCRKIRDKCAKRVAAGRPWPDSPPRFVHLQALADRGTRWRHPEHMTPTGGLSPEDVRVQLERDRDECLELCRRMPAGEGTLHRIRMSVVGEDDRLELYQYLEVVRLHVERHVAQLVRNRDAFGAGR